jgi:hypothetical protein
VLELRVSQASGLNKWENHRKLLSSQHITAKMQFQFLFFSSTNSGNKSPMGESAGFTPGFNFPLNQFNEHTNLWWLNDVNHPPNIS